MFTADQAGNIGEWIAAVALTHPVLGKYGRPLFRPVFLGEKYPTADMLVDILGNDAQAIGFFFVQVRATTEPPNSRGRLAVKLDQRHYNRLARLPVPAYLVGVYIAREEPFVIAASTRRETGISSITTAFSLRDENVKTRLYKEVRDFWRRRPKPKFQTEFNDVY